MNLKVLLGVMAAGASATVIILAATKPSAPVVSADNAGVLSKPVKDSPAEAQHQSDVVVATKIASAQGSAGAHMISSDAPATSGASMPTQKQLDALLAPVALYPDQLLQQILMAATYPLDVVEASRWISQPENDGLTGDRLAAALENQDWDPSVKALTAFPQILKMMDSDLDWMKKLGNAFLTDQSVVMDSVQRLRREAQAADKLNSDPRQRVTVQDSQVMIEPANPDVVYVPFYDPQTAYGDWPYPDVPPDYIAPPYGYASAGGVYYSGASVNPFLGWSAWDWRNRRINIVDVPRYNYYNRGQGSTDNNVWHHDPRHNDNNRRNDNPGRGRDVPINMQARKPPGMIPPPGSLPNVTPPQPAQPAPMPDRNRFNDDRSQSNRQRGPEAPNNNAPNEDAQREQQFRQFQDRSINAPPLTNVPQRQQPTMIQQEPPQGRQQPAPPVQQQVQPREPRMAQPPPAPQAVPPPMQAAPIPAVEPPRPSTNFRQPGYVPPPAPAPNDGKDPCKQLRGNAC